MHYLMNIKTIGVGKIKNHRIIEKRKIFFCNYISYGRIK